MLSEEMAITPAKILLIVDEVMLARELENGLQQSGYNVIGRVARIEEAVRKAEQTHPDLILVDIELQGDMEGIETTTQIQSRLDTAIIYLTAHLAEDVFGRAKISGPQACLTKPISLPELARTVEMVLREREMRKKLEESEERFRLVTEATSEGIWDWDLGTNRVFRNRQFFSMLGYDPDDFTGVKGEWDHLVYPEDLPHVRVELSRYLAGETGSFEVEFRIRNKLGNLMWVLSRGEIVARGEDGIPLRMVGTHTDITARKQAEVALQESESRVRMGVESMLLADWDIGISELADVIDTEKIQSLMDDFYGLTNIGVGIVDNQGKVLVATSWQDICAKYHRVHPETRRNCEISDTQLSTGVAEGTFKLYRCKNNMLDIVTPVVVGDKHLGNLFLGQFFFEDEPLDYNVFRAQARRYGFDEEEYLAALDRVPRWDKETVNRVMGFYTKFMHIVSELGYSNIKLARSLAERDQLVNSLKESENKYRYLFENSPIGIISVDTEGRVLEANQSLLEILGSPSSEATKSINMFEFPQLIESGISHALRACMGSGEPQLIETPYTSKWGKTVHLKLLLAPLHDPLGNVAGCHAVVEDITQQKVLERELLQAQKLQSIGTLAGGIAHDFNNILQVVLGYSDMLLLGMTPGTQVYDELEAIRRAAIAGGNLANRILAFSRRLEPNARTLRLTDELNRMISTLTRIIPKMIKVDLILADDVSVVSADPIQMEQVLLNLAANAQHAMPEGGRFTIEMKNVTLDEDYCRSHPEVETGEYVLLSVSDTGYGMEKEVLERIFEPFYTTKEPGEGTGLGLAMVYGIIKGHNGHIDCRSEPGIGTTFQIYLPAVAEDLEPEAGSTKEMPAFGTETILLVDDEEGVRKLGAEILTLCGYTVFSAANGKEALEMYGRHQDEISLVVLDLIMPEMGGKQCLAELLRIDPTVRVLVASGCSGNGPIREALDGGATGFLSKPFEAKEFLRMVRKALDQR